MKQGNQSIWFAVDQDGSEWVFNERPFRYGPRNVWFPVEWGECVKLPTKSIQSITGRTLTWDDDPLEWKPGERQFKIPSEKDFEKELSYTTDYAQFINGANWAIEQIKKLNQ